jgi:hypothetical protein
VEPSGEGVRVVKVGRNALRRPLVDAAGKRVLLAAGSGELVALEIR